MMMTGESRILFAFWHGLGDNVMAVPALREFRRKEPDTRVGWAVRADLDVRGLMELCPYIDEIHPIFPDPFKLPTRNKYIRGRFFWLRERKFCSMTRKLARKHGYDRYISITTTPKESMKKLYNSYRYHKIFRIANEMGVEISDVTTEVFIDNEDRTRADRWLKNVPGPRVFVHREASIERKDLTGGETRHLLKGYRGHAVVECGKASSVPGSHHLNLSDIRRNIAVIEKCDAALCIDSANMHFAGALRIPLTAVFKTTPIHQALPLHYRVRVICDDEEYNALWAKARRTIRKKYPIGGDS
jgi:hypothetical protein